MARPKRLSAQPALPPEKYQRPEGMDDARARGWNPDGTPAGFPDPDDPVYGINQLRARLRAAQDVKEDDWASRTHLAEVRRERKAETEVFKAARAGRPVDVSGDPGLAEVAEIGEAFHRADRRVAFISGVGRGLGQIARAMSQAGGGRGGRGAGSAGLRRAAKRRY